MSAIDGHIYDIPTNTEQTKEDIIISLRCENAYLRGLVKAYEKFLKERGYIDDGEMDNSTSFYK